MKRISVVVAVVSATLLIAPNTAQAQDVGKVKIAVEGMVCTGCEAMLKSALRELDGVETVTASLKDGMAEITLKDRKLVNIADLRKAVVETKMLTPKEITISGDIDGRLVGSPKKKVDKK